MHIALCGTDEQKVLWRPAGDEHTVTWVQDYQAFKNTIADAYIDLGFENDPGRISILSALKAPVFINSVTYTLQDLQQPFIRFNGWKSFASNEIIEASVSEDIQAEAAKVFGVFNKKISWVPDTPGFIAPRVIAMIINEAYNALGDNVSSKKDIDTAMKLGTGYPYGPFEWASLIGLKHVYELLLRLQQENKRYIPAALLKKEVAHGNDPAY